MTTMLAPIPGKHWSVDEASTLLKRLYWTERELFRAGASRHMALASWEAKMLLPRHLWEATLHADLLRSRVLQMRYPKRTVDQQPPTVLIEAIHKLVDAQNDHEIIAGMALVFVPALIGAYERYLAQTGPLDDAPSVHLVQQILTEKRRQVAEGQHLLDQLPEAGSTAAWVTYLQGCLAAAGGALCRWQLQAWGFDVGVDTPMVADHYAALAQGKPELLLALLHDFETTGPATKRQYKGTFEAMGDTSSAQDCDYDWADEAIHLTYGLRWLRHLAGDEETMAALKEEARTTWNQWREAIHSDYEPFLHRINARLQVITQGEATIR